MLTPQETDELMQIMRQLKDEGTSIVFITHKLREVKAVADRITVIRRGKVVGAADPSAPQTELANLMVGRPVALDFAKSEPKDGKAALRVEDLTVTDSQGLKLLNSVSFDVHEGEILGVAGVQGNGQTELTEALLGLQENVSGHAVLNGTDLVGLSTKRILDEGVGFVPEDRTEDALMKSFSVAENLVLDQHDRRPFGSVISLHPGTIRTHAESQVKEFDIRTAGIDLPVGSLSGGNQQKVVMSRALSRDLSLFIASARSSSFTNASFSNETREPRSSSSRPNSTRCASLPTASQ